MSLVYTQSDIDTLKACILQGILIVRYDGPPARMVTYQSLDAMRALLASVAQNVATSTGTNTYRYLSSSKGT